MLLCIFDDALFGFLVDLIAVTECARHCGRGKIQCLRNIFYGDGFEHDLILLDGKYRNFSEIQVSQSLPVSIA